jgi:acyl-CoA dehydrogenase
MVLKHFDNQGRQDGDLPLVEWACRTLLYQAQEQLHGFLRNFPNRIVAAMLRVCIFPRGRMYSAPPDDLGREIVALITRPTETRARLCDGIYATRQPDSPLGQLQATLEMAERLAPLEEKIRDAIRADVLTAGNVGEVTAQAVERGLITADEARQLQEFDTAVLAIISVDDFDPSELRRVAQPATLPFHDTAGAVG